MSADAQYLLTMVRLPHPSVGGTTFGAPTLAQLRDAMADGIAAYDNITKAAAEAYYDARVAAGDWVVGPFVRAVPFGRQPIKPIGTP